MAWPDRAPPPAVLEGLRRHRDEVVRVLAGRASALLDGAERAAEALAAADPDLAHERDEVGAALVAEAAGDFGPAKPEEEHRREVEALLRAAARRRGRP